MDLTEAEEIKKRWQEHTEELYKKVLMTQITMMVIQVTHLEPDIVECEVTWALGSNTLNKAGGVDKIPAELFKNLKNYAVKVLNSVCQKI